MVTFSIGLLLAILTVLIFSFFINKKRTHFDFSHLRANCLITKYPIVFLSGEKNLFYFKNYWNQIPEQLAEHGYEVYNLNLDWKSQRKRKSEIHELLKHGKYHLIGDKNNKVILSELAFEKPPFIASIHIFTTQMTPPASSPSLVFHTIQNTFTPPFWSRFLLTQIEASALGWTPCAPTEFLDLAIKLAEQDLSC